MRAHILAAAGINLDPYLVATGVVAMGVVAMGIAPDGYFCDERLL